MPRRTCRTMKIIPFLWSATFLPGLFGCAMPVSEAVVREACAYMTDAEFDDATAVTRLALQTGLTKAQYVGLADEGCAAATDGVTPAQCETCLRAVADLIYGL